MSNNPILFTRSTLLAYLRQHEREYPEKGDYCIELRDRLLAYPPTVLQHDDSDRVIIFGGVQNR